MVGALAASAAGASASSNGITVISQPTKAYENSTCVVKVGQIADGSTFTTLHTCGETYTFNPIVTKGSVRPGGTWKTWGQPPFTEGPTPGLIENFASQLTITLSSAKRTVGMELEGVAFSAHVIGVQFSHGGTPIGGLIRNVNGDGGARLFAIKTTSPTATINNLTITISGDTAFAIAKLRVG